MQTLSFPGLKRLPLPQLFTYNVRIRKSNPYSDPEVVDTGLRSKRGLYPDPEQDRREEKDTEEKIAEEMEKLQATLFLLWQDLGKFILKCRGRC